MIIPNKSHVPNHQPGSNSTFTSNQHFSKRFMRRLSPRHPNRFCCSSAFQDRWRRPTTEKATAFRRLKRSPRVESWSILMYDIHKHLWFYRFCFIVMIVMMMCCHDIPWISHAASCLPPAPACCKDIGGSTLKVATYMGKTHLTYSNMGKRMGKTWEILETRCLYLLRKELLCISMWQCEYV